MSDKELYLSHNQENFPLFLQAKWLNLVCKDKWEAIVYREKENLLGVFVYSYFISKQGLQIVVPPFTPFSGPFILPGNGKVSEINSYIAEGLTLFLETLPKTIKFQQKWNHSVSNWLPFYWADFKQTTRYTYLIKPKSIEETWSNVREEAKRQIKKGRKYLKIEERFEPNLFFELIEKTYLKKAEKVPYSREDLKKLVEGIYELSAGKLFFAKNENEEIIGCVLFVWDNASIYYLIGGLDHSKDKYGTMSYLIWHGIEMANQSNRTFDFHGSMIKPIERFFRNFGGELTPYFQISKQRDSLLSKIKNLVRTWK